MTTSTLIASSTTGRIRLRSPMLKSTSFLEGLESNLAEIQGVIRVRGNPSAGSLIVEYDPKICSEDWVEGKVEEIYLEAAQQNRNRTGEFLGKATKVGMAATLTTAVVYGFSGKKKPHIRAGSAFLGFAALHMLRHSKRLLS